MENPSARLLHLLTLLQARRHWGGAELCRRLEVSPRTLRYDIAKVRDLGYVVHADPGVGGGYALQPGDTLPPLALDDEEAIATAIGLRSAAGVPGIGEPATTALVKLEQVMPWRLRGRINALRTYTESAGETQPPVNAHALVFLTGACQEQRRVRFDYTGNRTTTSRREVEPYRLIQMGQRWYLHAWDPARADWRSFRLDRIRLIEPAGARFVARQPPPPSTLGTATDAYYAQHHAVVLVAASIDAVRRRLPDRVPVEPVDDDRCRVHATGESPFGLALNLLAIDEDFTVEDASPDVRDALAMLGDRIAASRASVG